MKRYELFIENGILYLHWMCKEQHYGQSCSCKIIPLVKTNKVTTK
jgi:hypothetical protein